MKLRTLAGVVLWACWCASASAQSGAHDADVVEPVVEGREATESMESTNQGEVASVEVPADGGAAPQTHRAGGTGDPSPDASRAPLNTPAAGSTGEGQVTEPSMSLRLGAQLLGAYNLDFFDGDADPSYHHEFELGRLWLWAGFQYQDARAHVTMEGTRGAGVGALIGVGGNSLVVRAREAYVAYEAWDRLEIAAGIVPTLIAPEVTRLWGIRAVAQSGVRRFELLEPADLGATVRLQLPAGFGHVGIGFYNGEGYRFREQNRGKTSEYMAQLHPLAFVSSLRPLTLLVGYSLGSRGPGSVRQDRLEAGVAWDSEWLAAGVATTWVRGVAERAAQDGLLVEAWARVQPIRGLIFGARMQHWIRDLDGDDGQLTEWLVSAGYRYQDLVGAHLALTRWSAGDGAASSLPGYERWRLRLVVEGRFEGVIPLRTEAAQSSP